MRNKLIKDLAGKVILFAGGTGFFGKAILDYVDNLALDPVPEFIIVSRGKKSFDTSRWTHLKVQVVSASLDQMKEEDLPANIDFIIHGATATDAEGQTEDYLKSTLIDGTLNLLKLAEKLNPQGFLFLSSGAVYGMERTLSSPMKETETQYAQAHELYGTYKFKAEELCRTFYKLTSIPVTIARCFAFSGENLPPNSHFAITNFIRDAKAGRDIVIRGNGKAQRSYMDEEDLSRWLLSLLMINDKIETINIGSGEAITIEDLAKNIAGFFPGLKVILQNDPSVPQNYYVPDVTLARDKYKLKIDISLHESLRKMIKVVGL